MMKNVKAWMIVLGDGAMVQRVDGHLDVFHEYDKAKQFTAKLSQYGANVIRVEIRAVKPKGKP